MSQLYNRVRETTTTTGTGNLTLAGAVSGFHAFNDKVATGTLVRYVIAHQTANEHEYGLGTFTATSTLARTYPMGGSNGTSPVNLSAGTKDVFVDALAEDFGFSDMPHRTGQYYAAPFVSATNPTIAKDQLRVLPIWIPQTATYTRIGVNCTGVSTAVFRPGIYASDATGNLPGALVVDAGTISTASTGFVEATISTVLRRGWYWVGGVGQVVNNTIQSNASTSGMFNPQMPGNGAAPAASGSYYKLGVTGALPDPFGTPDGLTVQGFVTWLKI